MTANPESWTLGLLMGGESSRMGVDKALLTVADGEHVVERAVRRLALDCTEILLSTGANRRDLPESLRPYRQTADRLEGHGPLLGLESLLENARTPWVMVVPCDMPLLRAEHLQLLLAGRSEGRCVHFASTRRPRPFPLCVPTCKKAALTELIDGGGRRLREFLDCIASTAVPVTAEVVSAVDFNLNTPDDLARWRKTEDGGFVDGPNRGC